MKKITILALVLALLASCADNKVIDGVEYRPYGLLNEKECKNDSIHYEIAVDACFSGALFFETIAAPIYVFGFNLYEPVSKKSEYINKPKGVIE